jgi:hypothetical protein
MSDRPSLILKRLLLAFWATWLTIVLVTNVLDAAKSLGVLDRSWAFASGNYQFLTQATARYGAPAWINGVLFAGVIACEATATVLFWLACWRYHGNGEGRQTQYAAFTVSLLLWGAFLVADEVFIAYAVAVAHLRLFTAQLATLLAIAKEQRSGDAVRGQHQCVRDRLAIHLTLSQHNHLACSQFIPKAPFTSPGATATTTIFEVHQNRALGTNWEQRCQSDPNAPIMRVQGCSDASAKSPEPCNVSPLSLRRDIRKSQYLQELVPVKGVEVRVLSSALMITGVYAIQA